MAQQGETSASLPTPHLVELGPGLSLLRPLSRCGHGPGLIVLTSDCGPGGLALEAGVPSPLMKWAEEGYTVVEVRAKAWTGAQEPIARALAELAHCESCQPKEQVGLVGKSPSSDFCGRFH